MPKAPVVSPKEGKAIADKLRRGTCTIFGEARRIGCYHATLRKVLRELMGEKEYTRLALRKRATRPRVRRAPSVPRVRGAPAAVRMPRADGAPSRSAVADARLKAMDDPTVCSQCRGTCLPGTDGNGQAVFACVGCGSQEIIERRRAHASRY